MPRHTRGDEGQLAEVCSLLPPREVQALNSGRQARLQAPLSIATPALSSWEIFFLPFLVCVHASVCAYVYMYVCVCAHTYTCVARTETDVHPLCHCPSLFSKVGSSLNKRRALRCGWPG